MGKNILRASLRKKLKGTRYYQRKQKRRYFSERADMFSKLDPREKAIREQCVYCEKEKTTQMLKMLQSICIQVRPEKRFQMWIDTGLYVNRQGSMTDNIPPNYKRILDYSIEMLMQECIDADNLLSHDIYRMLCAVCNYVDRIITEIEVCIQKTFDTETIKRLKRTIKYFENMKDKPCKTFEEGCQRILFWSSLFWQSQHRLVGLGRLDKIMANLELPDNEQEQKQIIADFYEALHLYFPFKSNGKLLGDTGQIIELGGLEESGGYYINKLTYLFIQVMEEKRLPDPKILLRVSSGMPDELLRLAINCISTGVGCPLLSNDDVVIPALEAFGYERKDAFNYVTSACWEPLVYGKSLDKNNLVGIQFAKVFENAYLDERFSKLEKFDDVMKLYLEKLDLEMDRVLQKVDQIVWEEDPLMSLFTENCLISGRDISNGGAVYNNYGLLSVGLANAVDSLLNIKRYVFLSDKYSLAELRDACIHDFEGIYLKDKKELFENRSFGCDESEVADIVKQIANAVTDRCKKYRNFFGGKIKWGLSASSYVESGMDIGATMDGRNAGEPLAVHISSSGNAGYTELINFACQLDYSGERANGNVVDFFVSPAFIQNNFEKFYLFIKNSIKKGFFQMQMNVVSSKTLIEAKKDPEKFPNLIVRVWGFSAYFKDLPENYKDVLIKRALENERTA